MTAKQEKNQSKNKKYTVIFLALIVACGIFLRAYHFSDWLRFNSDQARDASVVRSMIEEKKIQLLGPVAGGTEFKLGPAFYYFQYVSAKIFGAFPDKMAYPDLFFGIVSIPLSFLLFRRYFKTNITLILAGLYSTAFFTVQYSRFAWNPNATQFFDMLFVYSMLNLSDGGRSKKIIWIVLAGISLGVSMQLHTFLLFGMPLAFSVISIYLLKNKSINFYNIIAIAAFAFVLNIPQIASEIKSGGMNYFEFKDAIVKKSVKQNPLWKNVLAVVSCQIQSNAKILVPYADQEACESPFAEKYLKRIDKRNESFSDWFFYVGKFVAATIFSFAGYFLLYRKTKNEGDERKKRDFQIVILFNAALLVIFIPFGAEISLRYFILLAFIPFLLLGLCLEAVSKKLKLPYRLLVFSVSAAIISYNMFFCVKTFKAYANNVPGNMIDGTMDQTTKITEYLVEKSGSAKKIQLGGQKVYLGRFVDRISYFAKNSETEIIELDGNVAIDRGMPLFAAVNEMSEKCKPGTFYKYGYIEECANFFDVTILKINPSDERKP